MSTKFFLHAFGRRRWEAIRCRRNCVSSIHILGLDGSYAFGNSCENEIDVISKPAELSGCTSDRPPTANQPRLSFLNPCFAFWSFFFFVFCFSLSFVQGFHPSIVGELVEHRLVHRLHDETFVLGQLSIHIAFTIHHKSWKYGVPHKNTLASSHPGKVGV